MAAFTLEQLKEVGVHLSDKEFEELVEAKGSASGSRVVLSNWTGRLHTPGLRE
jgi:hypothetical protein